MSAQLHFCNCPLGQTEVPLLQSLTCDITACGLINHQKNSLEPKPEVFSPESWDGGGLDLYTIIYFQHNIIPTSGDASARFLYSHPNLDVSMSFLDH